MSTFPSNDDLRAEHKRWRAGPTIISALKNNKHPNWGFVLVRTTYSNQSRWDEFMAEFERLTLEAVRDEPYSSQLEEKLEWTVLENRWRLDGATMLEASRYFLKWVARDPVGEIEAQASLMVHTYLVTYPRHEIFIYACPETIDSILDPARKKDFDRGNFVHLVKAPLCIKQADYEKAHNESMTDEAWLRAKADSCLGMYSSLTDPDDWYNYQLRHPQIVYR
ncbi:hypothetical protein PVAG01_11156 [Phlyctema vagabunda]|uniref:Uncharacterized protein n=1 Tax=Phlyctema vagabunda TaxID=108571 RepID=A0ABR4P222_9HELO